MTGVGMQKARMRRREVKLAGPGGIGKSSPGPKGTNTVAFEQAAA
jgi:predicted ATPase